MIEIVMKFPYEWYLKNGYPKQNGYKVFSTFACGGGSTMGYKLAGFDVIGMNEIDPKLAECYIVNHHPKYSYIEDLREFNKRTDLPKELYGLDILDGSPPCSTFSMAGSREKAWGIEKKFREGQTKQTLDDLLFVFIETCHKLQPKVCLLENVKGLTLGAAKKYCEQIYVGFDNAGYYVNHWLLDASKMGVPQKRERVFFIAIRKDLSDNISFVDLFETQPDLDLVFNEKEIKFIDCELPISTNGKSVYPGMIKYYGECKEGNNMSTVCPKGKNYWFNYLKIDKNKPSPTLASANNDKIFHYKIPEQLSLQQWCILGTFPMDYNFMEDGKVKNDGRYIIGMSVPPVMIAQIATRIKEQWLDKMELL